ncbi:MAG: 4-vinyl reductase [Thermodesulfobacteriota bacterium]
MENEILDQLHFVREKGGLFYKDVRYLLIRPETLATLQKAVEKEIGERAAQILFLSGFQGGALSSKKYREIFKFSDEEIVHFMVKMGPQIGWGRFEAERFDPLQKYLSILVFYSPFAEAYGASSSPVCHFIRGVLSGMASVVFDREIEATELACLAKGDECCRFEIM